jgi:hypothetical protein
MRGDCLIAPVLLLNASSLKRLDNVCPPRETDPFLCIPRVPTFRVPRSLLPFMKSTWGRVRVNEVTCTKEPRTSLQRRVRVPKVYRREYYTGNGNLPCRCRVYVIALLSVLLALSIGGFGIILMLILDAGSPLLLGSNLIKFCKIAEIESGTRTTDIISVQYNKCSNSPFNRWIRNYSHVEFRSSSIMSQGQNWLNVAMYMNLEH